MIKIYAPGGNPSLNSSAGRCFLILEEIGLEYEHVGLEMSKGEHKSEEYLNINPNGKIPCLNDNGFVIWESMAINTYLAREYKPELLSYGAQNQSLVDQWNYWVISEYQTPIVKIAIHMRRVKEEERDMEMIKTETQKILKMNELLDKNLEGKDFLVGNSLSLADLHVGLAVSACYMLKIDLSQYKNLGKLVHAVMSRPAFQKLSGHHKH